MRETADHIFVLAWKREGETKQFRFEGLPIATAEGDVLFESPRAVAVNGGSWTDWFAPFEVHVYRFAKRK